MTKRDLIAALERFTDNQEVYVCLFSQDSPDGSQVIIQGVASTPPWRDGGPDGSTDLIGLACHDRNALLHTAGKASWRAYTPTPECVESERQMFSWGGQPVDRPRRWAATAVGIPATKATT